MRAVVGAGVRPGGRAEGPAVWIERVRAGGGVATGGGLAAGGGAASDGGGPATSGAGLAAAERPAEILRFRAAVARAVQDLESWSEEQEQVAARVCLQSLKEALLEEAFLARAAYLIDSRGLSGGAAALEAGAQVSGVLGRSDGMAGRAAALATAARWLARRLLPAVAYPPGAVFVASDLSAPEVLDLGGPVVLAGPEPAVVGRAPLVWGVPGAGPDWAGCRIRLEGNQVMIGVPNSRFHFFDGDSIDGVPVCHVDGDPEAVGRMSRHLGQRPVALVRRLDDLAAVPLLGGDASAIAVDLEALGRRASLKHPGFLLLLQAAADTGRPLLAGGRPAQTDPDYWFSLGFTGLFGNLSPQKGTEFDAVRRDEKSGL